MMRISVVTAATLMAMMAWGCGSSSSSTGTPAANTDTTAVDTAAQQDTVATDTGVQADASATADAGPVDTGPIDAGKPDTGPPPSKKCLETDNPCIQQCGNDKCADQLSACATDIDCGKIDACLSNCNKMPPVQLPGEATWTCNQACFFTFGQTGTDKFFGKNLCLLSQCLDAPYTKPCGSNVTCQNYCAFNECDAQMLECINEPACLGFFSCLNTKCTDAATQQACAATCNEGLVATFGQAAAQKGGLAYTGFGQCAQAACL